MTTPYPPRAHVHTVRGRDLHGDYWRVVCNETRTVLHEQRDWPVGIEERADELDRAIAAERTQTKLEL